MARVDKTEELKKLVEECDLRKPEDIQAARSLAQTIEDADERAWILYELVKKFASTAEWYKAETVAHIVNKPYEQANAFREIAAQLVTAGEAARALSNLGNAENAALRRHTVWAWQQAEALARIGKTWVKANQRDQALRTWDKAIAIARTGEDSNDIQESIDCSSVLWEIAESLAMAGYLDLGRKVASSIKNVVKRDRAISSIERIASGQQGAWEDP